jgi:hypothetical protein
MGQRAASGNGCNGAVLLAHGFSLELLNELIGAGLATGSTEIMMHGSKPVEVLRMKITEADGGRFNEPCPRRSPRPPTHGPNGGVAHMTNRERPRPCPPAESGGGSPLPPLDPAA